MKDLLINTLESLQYPVFLQGTLNPDEAYPESFFTFWVYDSEDITFYDNNENHEKWFINVIFYSSDPALVASVPMQAREMLKAAGFIPQGRGSDMQSTRPTHTAWTMDIIYKEKLN